MDGRLSILLPLYPPPPLCPCGVCGLHICNYVKAASLTLSTKGNLFWQCLHPTLTNYKHVDIKRCHNVYLKFVTACVVFENSLTKENMFLPQKQAV